MKAGTNVLSEGAQPTASLILPLKHSIMMQLDSPYDLETENISPAVHEAKMAVKCDLDTR